MAEPVVAAQPQSRMICKFGNPVASVHIASNAAISFKLRPGALVLSNLIARREGWECASLEFGIAAALCVA
jgi:hypothetical protein